MNSNPITLAAAIEQLEQARFSEAASICDQILQDNPADAKAWHIRGIAHAQLENFPEAVTSFQQAIGINDASPTYHYNLGLAYQSSDQLELAAEAYREAVTRRPEFVEAQTNLGNCLLEQGDADAAVEHFQALAKSDPDSPVYAFNLANSLYDTGDLLTAIEHYRRAIEADPDLTSARENLGRTLLDVGKEDEAAEAWQAWLEHEPDNVVARHLVSATSSAPPPERCDDEYVRVTFDADFAKDYESQLQRIGYRGPELVQQAIEALDQQQSDLSVLDAGCGTGLCADVLRPLASKLVGVDLSADMIAEAAKRGKYDSLVDAELTRFLTDCDDRFDLVVCGDTLCYFGNLEAVLGGFASCLNPEGDLIFTVEAFEEGDGEDASIDLQPSGRYRHSEAYLREALQTAGFTIRSLVSDSIRKERGYDVAGFVVSAYRGP